MTVNKKRKVSQKNEDFYNVHEYGINLKTREIWLHAHLSDVEESGIDYRNAVALEKNINILNCLNSNLSIIIHMHTIGGQWGDGISIYDTIKLCPNVITIIAYAHATSMSSIILQAADYRVMMPNTDFMVHYGSCNIDSDSVSCISVIKWLNKTNDTMLNIYASRCIEGKFFKKKNYSLNSVKKYIGNKMKQHGDWHLTAEEAVDYGFADGILGEKGYESLDIIKKLKK